MRDIELWEGKSLKLNKIKANVKVTVVYKQGEIYTKEKGYKNYFKARKVRLFKNYITHNKEFNSIYYWPTKSALKIELFSHVTLIYRIL